MRRWWVLLVVLVLAALPALAQEPYFEIDTLNPGLPPPPGTLDRTTPQSSMESFLAAIGSGDARTAAHLLDLTAVPGDRQAARGPDLARKLATVLDRRVVIDWNQLLERPDALDANASSNAPMAGQVRRSLLLDLLDLDKRAVAIRLNRLKPGEGEPVWVFSRQSVDNIEALHAIYGPSDFERALPDALRRDAFWGLMWWEVIGLPLLTLGTVLLARRVWRVLGAGTRRWRSNVAGMVLRGLRLPATLALVATIVQMATSRFFVVSGVLADILQPLILMTYIAAILALIVNVIDVVLDTIIETDFEDMSAADAEGKRALATTVAAVRRLVIVAAVLLAAGIVLTSSSTFQAMGLSLLASAGALTILLGFAARNVLGNILSSMQIALNRSARIGDQLDFQGQLCQVEKIRFTFVQLRHWTGTRMIVPVETFASEVFHNRSIVSQKMLRCVTLTLSPLVDFDRLRADFEELVEAEEETGGKDEAAMRVMSQNAFGIDVRFEFPCPDPATAWDAECRLREALIIVARRLHEDGGAFPEPAVPGAAVPA